jgi:signal transduction histidine kinase
MTRGHLSAADTAGRTRADDGGLSSEAREARERDRLTLLLEVNNHVITKRGLDRLFHALAASIRRRLDADAAGLWLLNRPSGCLERRFLDFPTGKGRLANAVVTMPAELEGERWRLRTPHAYRPQEAAALPAALRDACRAEGILSAVSLPLLGAEGAALGLMTLGSRKTDAFGRSELDLLSQIATPISLALDNALAYDELRASRDALRRSEAYLAEAERLTHTGSWAFDLASYKYVHLSEEGRRIFEIDPGAELPSREDVSRLIHTEDWPAVDAGFEESIRNRVDNSSEFRITTPRGTLKHVLAFRHPVLDAGGTVVQLVGTVIDITERERREDDLRRSEEERRQAEAEAQNVRAELERLARVTTLAELAASIAHEINQPLAGLIASANAGLNWLAADPPNLTRAREALARVVRDGTRAGEVVSRIRSAVKQAPAVTQCLNLNAIVRDVLTLMGAELRQRGVEVALVLDRAVPDVLGDRLQLQQVLLNVVKNAIDAMADVETRGGTLRIQSAASELATKPAVLLDVSDNGAGLGVADPETLFEPFHSTKPHGMGMGLWISRWIIERHQGRLTAQPNDGPGATIRILLPAADGDAA